MNRIKELYSESSEKSSQWVKENIDKMKLLDDGVDEDELIARLISVEKDQSNFSIDKEFFDLVT